MEKLLTDFVLVGSGICHNIELTAKNDELEIAIINDCGMVHPDGIGLSLNKEKVTQLCGFF